MPSSDALARLKFRVSSFLGRSTTGRRIKNSARSLIRHPDSTEPVGVIDTSPNGPASPNQPANPTRFAGSHTAKDVRSVDPEKFALTFYSQFGEDATIRGFFRRREEDRLRSEPGAEPGANPIGDGFYVDVGCYHPYRFSNTMHFYENGWHGINIDPSVGTRELFDQTRPRDVNLECAVSEEEGSVTFFTSGYGGRSVFNTIDPVQAAAYRDSGRVAPQKEITVEALRLETILDRHLPEGQEISFLDVDVEGHDLEALRSNNWSKYRPILVTVESHLSTIDEVLADPKYPYMIEQGYVLQSWVRPNMIFRRVET